MDLWMGTINYYNQINTRVLQLFVPRRLNVIMYLLIK